MDIEMDLRFSTPRDEMHVIDAKLVRLKFELEYPARIRPGSKESSVLWERMRRTDGTGMPPIAHGVADPFGVKLIGDWIDSGAN